jgi:hypothetical protein
MVGKLHDAEVGDKQEPHNVIVVVGKLNETGLDGRQAT